MMLGSSRIAATGPSARTRPLPAAPAGPPPRWRHGRSAPPAAPGRPVHQPAHRPQHVSPSRGARRWRARPVAGRRPERSARRWPALPLAPESADAAWSSRSAKRGNSSNTLGFAVAAPRGVGGRLGGRQVLLHSQAGENGRLPAPAAGPRRTRSCGRQGGHVLAASVTVPDTRGAPPTSRAGR